MALVIADRVRETSATTGTGTFTLAGAVTGFQSFSTAIGNANTCYYAIVNVNEYEVGLGTVGAGTIARTTVLMSSNANALVNFSAGTKDVFVTYPAGKAVYKDSAGNVVGLQIGTDVQAYDADLGALAALATTGVIARTGAGTVAARMLTAGTNISITNGDGVAGDPTINVINVALLAANTFTAAQEWATGTAVASAATVNLNTATGNRVHITGTTTITAVTLTRGPRTVIFDGILTLTHNATTNNLPGAVNITTAAGDRAIYEADGTTVYCVSYVTAASTVVTLAGVQSLTNKTNTDIVYALTGTTPAFTATNGGVQTWTLTAASTPTNSLTTGQSMILVVTPGAFSVTWPAATVWTKQGGSGAAPTLFSSGKTSVVLWMVGSVLYGSHLGDTA